jgi:chitodextrinase
MAHRNLFSIATVITVVIAMAAFPAPALAQQAAAFTNPLDQASDVSQWYFFDYWNYWAVDNSPIAGHDSAASLNWNNGTDINDDYNYGYYESEAIDLTGLSSPVLAFWCLWDLPDPNNFGGIGYLYFGLYDADGNYWEWSMGPSGYDLECGSSGDWHQHTLVIPQEVLQSGSFTLTMDTYWETWGQGSDYQGWFMDNLQVLVPDVGPPDAIGDLAAANPKLTEVELSWTAPHDDDVSGATASFDLRYSTSPVTGTNFDFANAVTGESDPGVEGTPHTFLVTGLTENTTYFFAIRTTDLAGNVSTVSNVASITTLAPPPPPATTSVTEEVKVEDDILPCSAGTTAAPTGLLALAVLIALAAFGGSIRR